MRSKLSQPLDRTERSDGGQPSGRAGLNLPQAVASRFAAVVDVALHSAIAMMILVMTTACPIANRKSQTDAGETASTARTIDQDGPAQVEFRWPSDPGHPVMRLEVYTKDSEGTIEIELMPEIAPASVEQLIELAHDGHYDGTTFHRVIRGFMIQGGDPNSRDQDPRNDGHGGTTNALPDEFSAAPFVRGVVALANRGRTGSNSSQFFIVQSDHRELDGKYTAIGRVVSGIDFVDSISNTPTDKVGRWGPQNRPIENVVIRSASISGSAGQDLSAEPHPEARPQPMNLSQSGPTPTGTGAGAAAE